MKKIILTEKQTKKLMDNVITEQVPSMRTTEYPINEGRYHMQCRFDFQYNDDLVTYKGGEIDNIDYGYGDVTFLIDMQYETYGIKGIEITDLRGPKSIKTKIRYYSEGTSSNDEDWWEKRVEEDVIIPLDWKNLNIDNSGYKMNYFGVDKIIDVDVYPDGNGGIVGKKIEMTTKIFKSEED